MIIQCPACSTQAKLPESKEGAKVRCSDCGRVYVARPLGTRTKKEDPTKYFIIGGVVLVVAIVMMWINSQPADEIVVAAEEPEEEVDTGPPLIGWDSALVKMGRDLHELVLNAGSAESGLLLRIDPEYVYKHNNAIETEEPSAEEPDAMKPDVPAWITLAQTEQKKVMREAVADLFTGEARTLVGDWKPFDGWIVSESDTLAVIRLKVSNREDAAAPDQHVEWRFVKRGIKWKCWYWERWWSPEELDAIRLARTKKTVKKTLSDGSVVIEGVMRDLGHLEDTPQEMRDEIDRLIGDLVDIDARPKVKTVASAALLEIGRPAVPPLLSNLAELPLESEHDAMRLMRVHMMLTEMTDYRTTFDVHDAMGGSKERRESGLKQWFGWYDRKWKKYTGPPNYDNVQDPLWDLQPRNAKEKREFDKIRKDAEAAAGG